MSRVEIEPGIFRNYSEIANSSNVVPLVSKSAVEAAWEEYAAWMRQAENDPSRWSDREWVQQRAVLNRRFDQLYLRAVE